MIKKYLVSGALCIFCCPIFSSTQGSLEQNLIDRMKEAEVKIAKNKTDFRNALTNDLMTIRKMKLDSSLELVKACKTLRDSLITYLQKSEEPAPAVLKALFELLKNAPGFLAIFLERDNMDAHKFILSKVVDPGYTAGSLEATAPAPKIRDEMRKNLQLINEHKNVDDNYIKLLEPLIKSLE